jgi:peptidylprolyl isomerase
MKHLLFSLIMLLGLTANGKAKDLENTLYLDLKDGRIVIQMLPEKAPKHVKRIKQLVRDGFYDGIVFHRVIDGFMAQTGDPTGTGTGGSGKNIKAEFNDVPHDRGVVSMARAANINSADSQFFIVFKNSNFLDGQYTAWGRVTDGMEFVDNIKKGSSSRNGEVDNPDRIIRMQVAADAKD